MEGLLRPGTAKVAFYRDKRESGVSYCARESAKRKTYRGVEKAFILHTNCFAEHFVFE